MFVLTTIRETIRLHHARFRHDLYAAIVDELCQKYCNRVIPKIGLCVSVFDVLEWTDPYVHPGEASACLKITFRIIVFRPFIGEVLTGRVRNSSNIGLHISLDFFDDILIPSSLLPSNSTFDPIEQVWVWNYEGSHLFMDAGQEIRVRVLGECFEERPPLQKEVLMARLAATVGTSNVASQPATQALQVNMEVDGGQELLAPYRLTCTLAEDGLGLVSWWR